MTLIYGNLAPQMKGRLFNILPGMRWVPHDIPDQERNDRSHRIRFSRKSAKGKEDAKDELQDARFPLHRRKSTLSLTSMPDPELDARTHPQAQSMFFSKLPIEIRVMVYELLAGGETVHLTLGARRKFGHFLCEEEHEGWGDDTMDRECACRVLVGGRDSRKLDPTMLNLLRVSRRIYSEAIPHLYTPHTFSLLHITHLLYLPSRLPESRLNNIRTLRLRWSIRALPFLRRPISSKRYAYPEDTANWIRGWKILAHMKRLRNLYVVVMDPNTDLWKRSWQELEEQLLEPVKHVQQTRCFDLVLPYANCGTNWDMGICGVVLRKPEGEVLEEEEEE